MKVEIALPLQPRAEVLLIEGYGVHQRLEKVILRFRTGLLDDVRPDTIGGPDIKKNGRMITVIAQCFQRRRSRKGIVPVRGSAFFSKSVFQLIESVPSGAADDVIQHLGDARRAFIPIVGMGAGADTGFAAQALRHRPMTCARL